MSKPEIEDILPQDYIRELYESFQAMASACLNVKQAIISDREDYPVYVPTYLHTDEDKVSHGAREAAIESITQLYIVPEDTYIAISGLVCASPNTVTLIHQLNEAKKQFKAAVIAIRTYQKDNDVAVTKIDKLISDEITDKGYRTDALKNAMGTAGISALDLKRCYAQIRIVPENLEVFSWTWATTHSRIKKVLVTDALAMARSLTDDKNRDVAIELLNTLDPKEKLVRKISLGNQLRANYAYKEKGILIRKSCPVSGVVIAQQKNMPRKLWRDNPETTEFNAPSLKRVSSIESDYFIKSLKLYRYVKQ